MLALTYHQFQAQVDEELAASSDRTELLFAAFAPSVPTFGGFHPVDCQWSREDEMGKVLRGTWAQI